MLDAGRAATLAALHEKLLAGLTSDRASARRLCRLCDVDACGHERGTCPVTEAVGLLRLEPLEDRRRPLALARTSRAARAIVAAVS